MHSPEGSAEAEALLARIASGDEAALTRLVAIYGKPVRAFAGRFLGSTAEGEEVAQDVFVAIWRKASTYDPARGAAPAWIWRIARNACIDRQRRRRLRWLVGLDELLPLADQAPGAERVLDAKDRLGQVRAGMAALPGRQRMALLLAAVGGMDTVAIAGIMGTSRGSVEQLLVRARRALRERIGESDG